MAKIKRKLVVLNGEEVPIGVDPYTVSLIDTLPNRQGKALCKIYYRPLTFAEGGPQYSVVFGTVDWLMQKLGMIDTVDGTDAEE